MVGYGLAQGLSVFAIAGIVCYSENCKKAKMQLSAERYHQWIDTNLHCAELQVSFS